MGCEAQHNHGKCNKATRDHAHSSRIQAPRCSLPHTSGCIFNLPRIVIPPHSAARHLRKHLIQICRKRAAERRIDDRIDDFLCDTFFYSLEMPRLPEIGKHAPIPYQSTPIYPELRVESIFGVFSGSRNHFLVGKNKNSKIGRIKKETPL